MSIRNSKILFIFTTHSLLLDWLFRILETALHEVQVKRGKKRSENMQNRLLKWQSQCGMRGLRSLIPRSFFDRPLKGPKLRKNAQFNAMKLKESVCFNRRMVEIMNKSPNFIYASNTKTYRIYYCWVRVLNSEHINISTSMHSSKGPFGIVCL